MNEYLLITKEEWARIADIMNSSSVRTTEDAKMWRNVKSRGELKMKKPEVKV